MKKTVTLPDGTTEVLEGTPEEIAAHERLVREGPKKKAKPDVLKGLPEGDDLANLLKEWIEKNPVPVAPVNPWPWPTQTPIWLTYCSRCGGTPCHCPFYEPQITYGGNDWNLLTALTCSTIVYDSTCGANIYMGHTVGGKTESSA